MFGGWNLWNLADGCARWGVEGGILRTTSHWGIFSSRVGLCRQECSQTLEQKLQGRQGDSGLTEADPGIEDAFEYKKSGLLERKTISFGAATWLQPQANPKPFPLNSKLPGSTYKLALAASAKPQEHPCCGEGPDQGWMDVRIPSQARAAP